MPATMPLAMSQQEQGRDLCQYGLNALVCGWCQGGEKAKNVQLSRLVHTMVKLPTNTYQSSQCCFVNVM